MPEAKIRNSKLDTYFAVAIFALLIFCIKGWKAIPMHSTWGIDLQCIWAFHNCFQHANSPYLIEGSVCGDMYNRPMVYPPLHYWTFAWTRLLTLKDSIIFLAIAIMGTLILSYKSLVEKKDDSLATFAFWTLLILQYPTIFQIERGSNDLPVFLWFLLSFISFQRTNYVLSGFFASLCAATKLYPVFFLIPLIFALITNPKTRSFFYGSVIGMITAHIFTPIDSINYYLEVMPKHASNAPPIFDEATVSHSVRSIFPSKTWLALALFFTTIVGLAFQAKKYILTQSKFIFFLGIALSSYFASVSYDYHLILVYPFLLYFFIQTQKQRSFVLNFLLVFAILAFFTDRQFLIAHKLGALLTKLQFAWLALMVFAGPRLLKFPLKKLTRAIS